MSTRLKGWPESGAVKDWIVDRFDEGFEWLDDLPRDEIRGGIAAYCDEYRERLGEALDNDGTAYALAAVADKLFEPDGAQVLAAIVEANIRAHALSDLRELWESYQAAWQSEEADRFEDDRGDYLYSVWRDRQLEQRT